MKFKLILVTFFIFFSALLVNDFLQKNQKRDIENLALETKDSISMIYTTTLNTYKLSAQKEYYSLLQNKKALEILKQFKTSSKQEQAVLRGELYRHYITHYEYLKTLNVRQFHFHTHKGESLLRFHVPHSNGDNLQDIRYSVRYANSKLKSICGFEGGKIYPGFRYLFPIIDNKEHLGSIEYSISFEGIEKVMKQTFPEHTYQLHLDKSISYDKVFKGYRSYFEKSPFGEEHYIENKSLSKITSSIKANPLIDKINNLIKNNEDFIKTIDAHKEFSIPIVFDDHGYVVSFISINDTLGNHAAYLVAYSQNDQILEINEKYNTFYIMLVVIAFIILILLYIVIYQIEKIIKQKSELEKTNVEQFELITEQKDELETIFETTKDGIAIVDLQTKFLLFNKAYLELTEFTHEELLQLTCIELTDPNDMQRTQQAIEEVLVKGYLENFEKTCIVKGGKKVTVNMSIALMPDKQRFLISAKDITEQKLKEKKIHDYVELIDKNIITSSTDIVGRITYASEAFCEISGYTKEELIGASHNIVRHPDSPESLFEELWLSIKENKTWKGEIKNRKKNGGYYWVSATISPSFNEVGEKIGYTAIRQDITDKKTIEQISITDGLTELYNRRHFNDLFPRIINSAKREKQLVSFIVMDIDHFKQYNDTYGHQMGDNVLVKVAATIKESLHRADDYCFRLGGEEFGIIFKTDSKEKALEFANSIRENIEHLRIKHSGNSISNYVTASIGLICKNANEIESDKEAYKEADELLYKAKKLGRNRVCCIDSLRGEE